MCCFQGKLFHVWTLVGLCWCTLAVVIIVIGGVQCQPGAAGGKPSPLNCTSVNQTDCVQSWTKNGKPISKNCYYDVDAENGELMLSLAIGLLVLHTLSGLWFLLTTCTLEWVRDNVISDPEPKSVVLAAKPSAEAAKPSADKQTVEQEKKKLDTEKKEWMKKKKELEKRTRELEQKETRYAEKEQALQERESLLRTREEALWTVRLRQEAALPPPRYDQVYAVPVRDHVFPVAPYTDVHDNPPIDETHESPSNAEKK